MVKIFVKIYSNVLLLFDVKIRVAFLFSVCITCDMKYNGSSIARSSTLQTEQRYVFCLTAVIFHIFFDIIEHTSAQL